MTIYRPTVAQEMGGDHSINKALQEINRFAQGDIGLAEFRITIGRLLPGDPIIVFLGKLQ